ncbi:MAG: bifunctional YncE family protein/alkaline phosphatase family protein [Bryobacteraceae bacterium]
MRFPTFALLILAAALVCSQPGPREQVGPLPGGRFLLNSGWVLEPAGAQVPLDTFPMSAALSPDGRYLLALNAGYRPPSISVLETATGRELGRTPVADGWLGLAFSPKGDRVYVGGGSRAAVFEFTFAAGALRPARTFTVVPDEKRTVRDFIGDVALAPDGRLLFAADLYRDSVVVINTQSGMVIERFKTGRRPYRILFHPDGKSFFVTSWADGSLGHYEANTGNPLATLRLAPHPTDMVWKAGANQPVEGETGWAARIFVAAANTNRVYTIGITASKEMKVVEAVNVGLTPRQPLGMTPSALALAPDGNRLYTVCSDANAVAVVDISQDRSYVLGFVPTGWYPTAARALADGRLVVLNGRGGGSRANPNGPNPLRAPEPVHLGLKDPEYVARIQTGSASFISPFGDAELQQYSKRVFANSPYRDAALDKGGGFPPSIEHVIYIVKENRTYDQVLGDMKQGNGDPSLVLFGERITPNHHKLAREFVLLDNFYVNSDVSADGHNWSTAAIAPDYVQKLWPNSYAGRRKLYDYAGQEPASTPPAGYLWTNAHAAGITMRNFGYWVANGPRAATGDAQVQTVLDPILAPLTNRRYRGFDLEYPDVDRARIFLEEFAEWERTGQAPRLTLMRLGNDHTSGAAPGRISPISAVADNDYALGMIVEAVSRSRFWPKIAIFVIEDDAQNGADHVDSHRSPAFVVSPYVKRGSVDSSMYNTASVLRSIELILGLRPMTQFDAAARPMTACFTMSADTAPYIAEKPRVPLDQRNAAASPGAAASARLDFSEADRIDDYALNAILWQALKGTEPPPPVRSSFAR